MIEENVKKLSQILVIKEEMESKFDEILVVKHDLNVANKNLFNFNISFQKIDNWFEYDKNESNLINKKLNEINKYLLNYSFDIKFFK